MTYLEDLARQAGIRTSYIAMEDIGRTADGHYTDCDNNLIHAIFKLYPWESLFADEFSQYLQSAQPPGSSRRGNRFFPTRALSPCCGNCIRNPEPVAELFETPPEAASDLPSGWVRKPLFSREGANVELVTLQGEHLESPGPYADFSIRTPGVSRPAEVRRQLRSDRQLGHWRSAGRDWRARGSLAHHARYGAFRPARGDRVANPQAMRRSRPLRKSQDDLPRRVVAWRTGDAAARMRARTTHIESRDGVR